jgi:hypothetical protein
MSIKTIGIGFPPFFLAFLPRRKRKNAFRSCENPKDGLTEWIVTDLQRSQCLMNYCLNQATAIPQ